MITKTTPISTTNRFALTENCHFYGSYEKTNNILGFFGRDVKSTRFNNYLIKTKSKTFANSTVRKRGAAKLTSISQNLQNKNFESTKVVSSRGLIRRIRRFDGNSPQKGIELAPKKSLFGVNKKTIFPKPFSFSKVQREKAVPTLVNSSTSIGRSSQNWDVSFAQQSFKTTNTKALSRLIGSPVHLRRIPAFSFARYGRDLESVNATARRNKELGSAGTLDARPTSAVFLRHITEERRGRFQYVAIQIPDLLRLSFVGRYFKNPTLIAQLFARTLGALPRNRKETQFLRFLLKVVKVFSAQRPERLGVRIRFKGRVNRWRRTKHVIGEKGLRPLYTYSARVERGEAQAITRKGTLGIRIWLSYKNNFARAYDKTFKAYLLAYNYKNRLFNVSSHSTLFPKG